MGLLQQVRCHCFLVSAGGCWAGRRFGSDLDTDGEQPVQSAALRQGYAMTAAPVPAQSRPSRLSNSTLGIILALPALALFAAVIVYPLGRSLVDSLYNQSLVLPGRSFAGLANFRAVLDGPFVAILERTFVFTIGATVASVGVGLALALALNARVPGRHALRGLFILPWVLPGVVVSFVWLWIFNANYGVLNGLLTELGIINEPVAWLSRSSTAMLAVIVAKTWNSFPWIMLMLLAAIQTIPSELYDAAALDGAGAINRFKHITIPQIRPILSTVTLLEFIWNFQQFDILYVLTKGGPGDATTTFSIAVYNMAFESFDIGKAAALGALWMGVLTVLVIGYIFVNERKAKTR